MRGKIFVWLLILSLLATPIFGMSDATEANNSLSEAKLAIQQMKEANFSVQRVTDLFLEAEQIFKSQVALKNAGGKPDFSLILDRTKKILELKEKSFRISDELKALRLRIDESDVNTSEVEEIYLEAVKEFNDERYDRSEELIEKAYRKLSELESRAARIAAFYEAVSKTFENFIKENWKKIVFISAIILLLLVIFHNRIKVYRLKRKLERLKLRRKVLNELIAKNQMDYFQFRKIGEDTFHIREKKFGELVRDIDRQIPLIREQLAKVRKKK